MFNVPEDFGNAMKEAMASQTGVQLPFSTLFAHWGNGEARNVGLSKTVPGAYFGGWFTDLGDLEELEKEYGTLAKSGMAPHPEHVVRSGKSVPSAVARSFMVAPVCKRVRYTNTVGNVTTVKPAYEPGFKSHIQMLCLIASYTPGPAGEDGKATKGVWAPWGPAILSAKVFQGQYLENAVKNWAAFLKPALTKFGVKAPSQCFWMRVGTFGPTIQTELVGKSGAQSPITPIRLFKPGEDAKEGETAFEVTQEYLEGCFVGAKGMDLMREYLDASAEWRNDPRWLGKSGAAPAGNGGPAEPEFAPFEPNEVDAADLY